MWKGYIKIVKNTGIVQGMKGLIKAISPGEDQAECTTFRDSLNGQKSYIRLCIDMEKASIESFFGGLGLDDFTIFDDENITDPKVRFKKSCELALVDMQGIITEMEAPNPITDKS